MKNDSKIMIGSILVTFLLIIGFIFFASNKKEVVLTEIQNIEVKPSSYDLGNVPLNGGNVSREYEVINMSENPIKIKKLATSCMCTQAKVSIDGNESSFYGMEHPGDKNPPINIEIPAGKSAKVTTTFDPAAHGPTGTGPFNRTVVLTFTQPDGIKELTFSGTVVSE